MRPLPGSLRQHLQGVQTDLGHPQPSNGDLTPWTDQGVLLLNRVLTVDARQARLAPGQGLGRGHRAGHPALVARDKPLVAILWGRDARNLAPMLGSVPCIESAHPSPLSARNGFFGSRPFSRANELLDQQGAGPVEWKLP